MYPVDRPVEECTETGAVTETRSVTSCSSKLSRDKLAGLESISFFSVLGNFGVSDVVLTTLVSRRSVLSSPVS